MGKGVSINPSSFSDSAGLLDLPLADVVALLIDKEKRRSREAREDENQQEAIVGCKSVPAGLMMALDGNARRLGVTRAMLTRCASHQIIVWIDSLIRIKEITGMYNIACDAAEEFGYPDLYNKISSPNYEFANTSPRPTSFRTIQWAKNKLSSITQPLGVPVGYIFAIGLCYSLTGAGDETRGTIERYLSAEIDKFREHVDERSVWVVGFHDLVRKRANSARQITTH